MLALLLDEQISPRVARQAGIKCPGMEIHSIHTWRGGLLLGQEDSVILRVASPANLTLVTYDLRSIPSILSEWSASGVDHAGVVLVDERTIPPDDFRQLVRALVGLRLQQRRVAWKNRVIFLRTASRV